ncbi:MAG: nucleotide pyrophosphohydrolase [Candidatus Aenigmatarchaeota archaeon]|nr:MAG: nucleotide pyrophosphohydrolase [Candidatus Aenigmarchaeota archaeon]
MKETFEEIVGLVSALRSDGGCEWDRKQTIESMKKDLMEEAEEVAEAIDKKDYPNLQEELGDLLWSICLMAQIAKEEGHFDMGGILKGTKDKIIRRHPHVFGRERADTPDEAMECFMRAKRAEKA